jgi:hypothetical protein
MAGFWTGGRCRVASTGDGGRTAARFRVSTTRQRRWRNAPCTRLPSGSGRTFGVFSQGTHPNRSGDVEYGTSVRGVGVPIPNPTRESAEATTDPGRPGRWLGPFSVGSKRVRPFWGRLGRLSPACQARLAVPGVVCTDELSRSGELSSHERVLQLWRGLGWPNGARYASSRDLPLTPRRPYRPCPGPRFCARFSTSSF